MALFVVLTPALVSSDDQVKAYIKKIMSQLSKWMVHGKISKLVVVITSKETGDHLERWQFDVCPHWIVPPPLVNPTTRFNFSPSHQRSHHRLPQGPPTRKTSLPPKQGRHLPLRTKPKRRSRTRSRLFSGKSPPPSPFCHSSTATVLSTCLCMQMQIVTSRWNGAIATRKKSRMVRRCN